MADMLTIFLLISSIITGIFWLFYRIKSINKYFIKKKNHHINLIKKDILHIKKNMCFFESLASFFPVFLTIFIIRAFFYEPFQIPSGSMMPTLLVGDFILVEKFSYGIKEPITHKTLINFNHPKRGDIIVFRHPENNLNYIKRVIGLPGDKIQYNEHKKNIEICKNYLSTHHCTEKIFIHYSKSQLSNFTQKIYLPNEKNSKDNKKIYYSIYFNIVQENIDHLKHNILLFNNMINTHQKYYKQKNMPKLTWIIPEKQYFVLGDNRDNSFDSRFWGFVPEKNLVGKAIKIWMSFEKEENEWPTGIRINRIGNIH